MLRNALVIAVKELVDSSRDRRSMLSSLLYCLMGPAIVGMVSLATAKSSGATDKSALVGMISVFTLVSTFMGGMNVAMDVLAGERERRSLVPLMTNALLPVEVLIGKWLAVCCLSSAGVLIALGAFAMVLGSAGTSGVRDAGGFIVLLVSGLIPLAMFAAALELVISTGCKNTKEAHTYLSILIFVPMTISMGLVFNPAAGQGWIRFLPLTGQLWQLQGWLHADDVPVLHGLVVAMLTAAVTAGALAAGTYLLNRDDIVYGD